MQNFILVVSFLMGSPFVLFGTPAFADQQERDAAKNCSQPITVPAGTPCQLYGRYLRVGKTLYVEGVIDAEFFDILNGRDHLIDQIDRIELNSPGGDVRLGFAYDVAALVRAHGITTSLRPRAQCASACTVIYQAGVKRVAAADSFFMYHTVRFPDGEADYLHLCLGLGFNGVKGTPAACKQYLNIWTQTAQGDTDLFYAHLEELGASPKLYADYKTQPHDDDWLNNSNPLQIKDWFLASVTAATDYGIVTELVPYAGEKIRRPVRKTRPGMTPGIG